MCRRPTRPSGRARGTNETAVKSLNIVVFALLGAFWISSCSGDEKKKVKEYDYVQVNHWGDKKALYYNLVGRWYPEAEVARLDNEAMTPKEWCARPPAMINVILKNEDIEVVCADGKKYRSPVARIDRDEGGIHLILRTSEDSLFKQLTFKSAIGSTGIVLGNPCSKTPKEETFLRFPKREILERQILGGKRCEQIAKEL